MSNTPKIRFSGFTEDWEQRKLSELSDFITKGATPTTYGYDWQESGIPFFRNDAIKDNQFIYGDFSYISEEANELIKVTEESFFKGLEFAKVGNRLTDISHEIQRHVEASGFSVVRDFVGHGIGRSVHEDPEIPNFGRPGRGPKLVAGMTLAIEPMVNMGTYRVATLGDDWTVVSADRSLSAHYENTVVILPDGPEILTLIK